MNTLNPLLSEDLSANLLPEITPIHILEGLNCAVFWVNLEHEVMYLNIAAAELLQMSPSRIVGARWQNLFPGLMTDLNTCGFGRLTIHEHVIELPDGQKTRVTCTFSYYEFDSQAGWLVEILNTERHHRIVEEDERWHQYEAGNLLAKTLAHEIKNPLAGIYGATQLLQKRFPENQKAKQFLEVISNEVNRLKNLVDRMLGPGTKTEKEPQNLHEIIRYVLDVIAPEKPNHIFIRLDYDPSIPEISMDFESMVQAFLNLIQNGMQAMEQHGGFLTIRTRVESKFTLGSKTYPLVAVVSIIDEGEGILPEFFDSIFYPMVTSKKEGTGLGLPVSQNIVRNHGGLIVAESEPGHTVFNVYLPFDHNRGDAAVSERSSS